MKARDSLQPALCVALMTLGLATMLGWLLGVEALKSVLPGLSTMKFNTAFTFVLVGSGLLLAHRGRRVAAVFPGVLVVAIGAATLVEYALGTNIGIDELVVADRGTLTGSGVPGRMSPLTAMAWVALGSAIVLLATGKTRSAIAAGHGLATVAGFVSFLAAAGYAFGAEAFWGIGFYTAMAVHTAVGLMVAVAAALLTRPGEGWLSHIADAPAAGRLFRELLPVSVGLPVTVGLVLVLGSGAGAYNAAFAFAFFVPLMTIALVLVGLHVTGRLRAEELALRENQARLKALTDHLPGGIVYQLETGTSGEDRRFVFVSENHGALTGVPARAVLADPRAAYDLIVEEDRAAVAAAEAEAIARRSVFDAEARFRHLNGDLRWCRMISAPREQPDGTLLWDGLQLDITAEKLAELALHESREHLAAALSIAQLGTFEWDLDDDLVTLDQRSRDLFGFAGDGPVPASAIFGRIVPADLPRIEAEVAAARISCRRLETDYRILLPDGSERHIASLSDATVDEHGRARRMTGVFGDITERKRLEHELYQLNEHLEQRVRARSAELERVHEQLRQSQKLEAMGQLTGGVAHDFNNLLTPIMGSLDILQRRGLGGEREQRLISGALESAERAKVLVQRLLAFARRQPLQPGPVDLGKVVASMVDLIASTSGPRIKVQVDVPDDLPPALADTNQLEMALLNLSVNARDAMPEGGMLSISVRRQEVAEGDRADLEPGRYLRLSVSDTGIGMDEATLERAVEPFFSTKGIGQGTGLGLSMVHGLASQLGGAVHIESRVGLGTTVDLILPESATSIVTDAEHDPAALGEGLGCVVLVDDEPTVRASTADMLADLGYQVVEFDCAADALRWLQTNHADCVVTDHLMPGMSGTEMAQALATRPHRIPTLIVSGYAEIDGIPLALPRLAKPFRQEALARAMAALIAGKPGS